MHDPGFLVQRGVFAPPTGEVNSDLYAVVDGHAALTRDGLALSASAKAHMNTYFGRFPASHWQRWTSVIRIVAGADIEVEGRGRMLLAASDTAGHRRVVEVAEIDGSGRYELVAPIDKFFDGGALWLEFEAFDSPMSVRNVEWIAPQASDRRALAIAICTFNRVEDCIKTVSAIASDSVVLGLIDEVIVVDQGTRAVRDDPRFDDVKGALSGKLTYFQQPNLGGAGGFSRGMYEMSATNPDADVVLMDDDIRCEPETVLRISAFAHFTMRPTLVGAQMLYLMQPEALLAGAEYPDLAKLQVGVVDGAPENADMLEKNQDRRIDAVHNAWWTCLIPGSVIREIGLPLPLFFQWDDIEYAIRARRAGFPTVTLPNAAVWHADFYWKDPDDWARFFSIRNSLIVSTIHGEDDPKRWSKVLFTAIAHHLVAMEYGWVHTILAGIEAYLDGPEGLLDGGESAAVKIREERQAYPETVMRSASEIEERSVDIRIVRRGGVPSKMGRVLAKRAVQQWLGRTAKGIIGIRREDAKWWHVSLFDHVVVTDSSQAGVRVRRRDKEKAAALMRRAVHVRRRLRAEAPALRARYRDAMPTLVSRDNWQRLYRL